MGLLSDIFGSKERRAERERQRQDETISKIYRQIEGLALSCRCCRCLGVPIANTRNRYRCIGCGRQYVAAIHDVFLAAYAVHMNEQIFTDDQLSEFYDKALNKLTVKHKKLR